MKDTELENSSLDTKFHDKNNKKNKDTSLDLLRNDFSSAKGEDVTEIDEDIELNSDEFNIDINPLSDDMEEEDSEEETEESEEDTIEDHSSNEEQKTVKDINSIFEIVNSNVKEATNLFNKNIEMKKRLKVN